MGTSTLLRGLPATTGIQDPHARQVIDAVIENLRANLRVSSTGLVYSGNAASAAAAAMSLENLGGGHPVGLDITNSKLRLRTIKAVAPVSITIEGNAIVITATGEGTSSYKVKITTDGSPDYLGAKLVSAPGATYPLLYYASDQGKVRGLKDGDGIILDSDGTEVTLTLAMVHAEGADVPMYRMREDGTGVVCGLNQGEGILLGSADDIVTISLGQEELDALGDIGKVRINGDDATLDYLAAKFAQYAAALDDDANVDTSAAVVFDLGAPGVKLLPLGNSAVKDVGTGAADVAAGNHSHTGLLGAPAADKSIVYASTVAGGWNSATLLSAFLTLVTDLSSGAFATGDKAIVLTSGGSLKLVTIGPC